MYQLGTERRPVPIAAAAFAGEYGVGEKGNNYVAEKNSDRGRQ